MKYTHIPTIAILTLTLAGSGHAATMVKGDVTTGLTGSFFVDDAATGGTDTSTTGSRNIGPRFWDLDSSGTIDAGDLVAGTISVTGFGFASNANASSNTATSLIIQFTYLGEDGVAGGGDDVSLGSETVTKEFSNNGEYFVNFDNPLTAAIDGLNNKFMVNINTNGSGNVVTKSENTLDFESFTGPKLSVAGTFTPVPEPSSTALFGLGGLAVLLRRRR
ncbi:MAG: PEP-CTERM sorting domain-containing protein [Akkermansiaceae bacterium]